jgi:hypothetical protein
VDPGPAPRQKLKSLYWDKLPEARLRGTVWEQRIKAADWVDLAELEAAFGQVIFWEGGRQVGV